VVKKWQKNNVEMLQNCWIRFYVMPIHFQCLSSGINRY